MANLENIFKYFTRSRSGYDDRRRSRRYGRDSDSVPDFGSLARRFKKLIVLAAVGAGTLLALLAVGVTLVVLNFSTVRGWAGDTWAWARGVAGQTGAKVPDLKRVAEVGLGGLTDTAREWGVAVPSVQSLNAETLATIGSLKILSDQVLGGLNLPAAELTAARAEVARVVQGLTDGRIVSESVTRLTEPLYVTDAQGNRVLRPIGATSVQRLIDEASRLADAAGVAPAPERVPQAAVVE